MTQQKRNKGTGPAQDLPFHCDFPGCERTFGFKIGRDRWTEEEDRMMARYINMALAVEFRGRSLDSIKSHRRGVAYKQLVIEMIEEVQREQRTPSPSPPPRPRGRRSLLQEPPPEEMDEAGRAHFFLTLDRPTAEQTAYNIHELFAICEGAPRRDKQQILTRTALYLQKLLPTPPLHLRDPQPQSTTKRKERRREYAKSQTLWKTHHHGGGQGSKAVR